MGCIASLSILQPESDVSTLELPLVALIDYSSIVEESLPEPVPVFAHRSIEFELFLRYHQFLI